MRRAGPVGKKILFLCIFLPWIFRAPGVQAAEDGVTLGEMTTTLAEVFGEYEQAEDY